MSDFIQILSPVIAATATIASTVLVVKATMQSNKITERGQNFEQQEARIEALQQDAVQLEGYRRALSHENGVLLRRIERYRAWAYGLIRLLHDHGVTDLPPEPEEAP